MDQVALFVEGIVKEEELDGELQRSSMDTIEEENSEGASMLDWETEMELDLMDPDAPKEETKTPAPKATDARSARADFVFDLVNLYLDRIKMKETMRSGDPSVNVDHCRKSLSFSSERNQMWSKVTERCNVRFGDTLGINNVEQIKKIYGNRLSRPKKNHIPSHPEELLAGGPFNPEGRYTPIKTEKRRSEEATPTIEITVGKKIKLADSSTPSTSDRLTSHSSTPQSSSGDRMDSILRAFDRSEEVTGLKEQLIEKDKEIDRLKKLIVKMSDSHLMKMESAMEMFKKALRDETAQEIINAIQRQ
ncbi:hypothetical protein PMAYCL1PPCAC_12104 [Pristionchus mayeri]|uniref:Uncharacterized protein n=1 Tax=Pristionchus mayeri TaxID=1317129 RepID=A0AAN4ZMB7_9BILA|nr:hypothetical protein PMAYCL1PPCAC_12104 [Pristionchus mayeri]